MLLDLFFLSNEIIYKEDICDVISMKLNISNHAALYVLNELEHVGSIEKQISIVPIGLTIDEVCIINTNLESLNNIPNQISSKIVLSKTISNTIDASLYNMVRTLLTSTGQIIRFSAQLDILIDILSKIFTTNLNLKTSSFCIQEKKDVLRDISIEALQIYPSTGELLLRILNSSIHISSENAFLLNPFNPQAIVSSSILKD